MKCELQILQLIKIGWYLRNTSNINIIGGSREVGAEFGSIIPDTETSIGEMFWLIFQ